MRTGCGAATGPESVPEDSVGYDVAMLDGVATGPGVVAYLRFKARAEGPAILTCLGADARDATNQRLWPLCSGARVAIGGPTPARALTWGRLKVIYR